MKVYLFDTNNGLFAGEAFEEPHNLKFDEGATPVPPPEYGHGQVPVFDRTREEWAVVPISIARQLLTGAAPAQVASRR